MNGDERFAAAMESILKPRPMRWHSFCVHKEDPMNEPKKHCPTCRYEPEWALTNPVNTARHGDCRCPSFKNRELNDVTVFVTYHDGQCAFDARPIDNCPGWASRL